MRGPGESGSAQQTRAGGSTTVSEPVHRLLAELTRDECRVVGTEGVVILPIGATEQHGPHLPIGTDSFGAGSSERQAEAAEPLPRDGE